MKIFGIGLSKTGTTSLARALEILGYRTKDYLGVTEYIAGDLRTVDLGVIDANDAFTDTPIPSLYRQLDARYPGSKFILTVRDMEGWLQSCRKQFNEKFAAKQTVAHNDLFRDLYGCTAFEEPKFRSGYELFEQGVCEYFRGRPRDLFVFNISNGDGWEELCGFLGKPIPSVPFPRANITKIRWINLRDMVNLTRRAGRDLLNAEQGIQRATRKQGLRGLVAQGLALGARGGETAVRRAAEGRVRRCLGGALMSIQRDLPVVWGGDQASPLKERPGWYHFWLVDARLRRAEGSSTRPDMAVSVALIEDNKPIVGVVYAPFLDIAYCAKAGEGAFKVAGHGELECLRSMTRYSEEGANNIVPASTIRTLFEANIAWNMCLIAESDGNAVFRIGPSMEWETAAAHAVLRAVGTQVVDENAGGELLYKKKNFVNGPLEIHRA